VGRKRQALNQLHQSLTGYGPLTELLKHTANASTLKAGARIVGDMVKLRPDSCPLLIFGLGSGDRSPKGGGPAAEVTTWDIPLTVFYVDVWQGADIMDALTEWATSFRSGGGVISKVEWLGHQPVDLSDEQDPEFLVQQALVRLHMVR
jgi:hypothetical protein